MWERFRVMGFQQGYGDKKTSTGQFMCAYVADNLIKFGDTYFEIICEKCGKITNGCTKCMEKVNIGAYTVVPHARVTCTICGGRGPTRNYYFLWTFGIYWKA